MTQKQKLWHVLRYKIFYSFITINLFDSPSIKIGTDSMNKEGEAGEAEADAQVDNSNDNEKVMQLSKHLSKRFIMQFTIGFLEC